MQVKIFTLSNNDVDKDETRINNFLASVHVERVAQSSPTRSSALDGVPNAIILRLV